MSVDKKVKENQMLGDKIFFKAMCLLGLAVSVFASDIAPFHFEGVDESKQEEYWDYLIKFKLWGTEGMSMGRASMPDESGWIGTARGGFTSTNDRPVLGGPFIIGGDAKLGMEAKLSTGPIRITGNFDAGANNGSGNYFAGTSCVDNNVNENAKIGVRNAKGNLLQGGNAHSGACDKSLVPEVKTDLKVPKLEGVGFSGSINVGEDRTGFLDVPSGNGFYDVYLESLFLDNRSTLHVRIPHEGRIVRVFVRNGLTIKDHVTIQIVNVGSRASYDASTQSYTDVGTDAKVIKNSEYAGNLLFYTTKGIEFKNTDNYPIQGSFITTGEISIKSNMKFAGQLIANKLTIGDEVDGDDFIYVPFNPPEIVIDDAKFVENDSLVEVPLHLTKTPNTDVYIDFCYVDGVLGGISAKEGADENDLLNIDEDMPYCTVAKNEDGSTKVSGKTRRVVIPAGSLVAKDSALKPWIRVKDDGVDENYEEKIIFYVTKVSGAVVRGNATVGGMFLTLIDKRDKITPEFDNSDPKLNVNENVVGAEAGRITGIIRTEGLNDENLMFEIIGGSGKDFFDIEKVPGKNAARVFLKDGVSLDYEALSDIGFAYEIEVKVYEDGETSFNAKNFKVKVNDVNENPIVEDTTVRVFEDVGENSTMPRIKNGDIDIFNKVFTDNKMVAIGGDTDVFTVLENGRLSILPGISLNHDEKSEYTLKVMEVDRNDETLFDTATITIKIDPVEDSPYFVGDLDGSVPENSPKGTIVNTVKATSKDSKKSLTYFLDDPSGIFTIDPSTGVVTVDVDDALDYETRNSYEVTLYVSNNGKKDAHATSEKAIISVEDVNENPIFEGDADVFSENLPAGSSIKTLTADDIDMDVNFRNNMFVLVGGDTAGFALDSAGVIRTTKVFDYEMEMNTVYTLKVMVRDVEDETLAVTNDVVLSLFNENEPPYITTTLFNVDENADGGTFVGQLESLDSDGDVDFTYVLFDGIVPFSVLSDGKIVVKEGAVIDYETKSSYEFTVRVKDEDGLYSDTLVTVLVNDVNEAPRIDKQRFVVSEDVDVPFTIGVIEVSDVDSLPKFSDLSCKIAGESKVFSVGTDCSLSVRTPLDYETDSLYTINVLVTDGEFSDTAEVTIVVTDVFEKVDVVITRAENKDSVWLNPDTIYVHLKDLELEWKVDGKLYSGDTTLKSGTNVIVKEYCDEHKNGCFSDTLVVMVSTTSPIVTVSADKKDVKADNIYTIVETVDEKDTTVYVNERRNDVKVTVRDSSTGVSKSFTMDVNLQTMSVQSSDIKIVNSIADSKLSLDANAEVRKTPENGDRIKVTYTERVNGKDVLVTYYTDKKGKTLKTPVVVNGKVKEVETITVSYTERIGGKNVTITYTAKASTGERVEMLSGVQDPSTDKPIVADYVVSYDYADRYGNVITVTYPVDEDGNIVKNKEGNTGYQLTYSYTNIYGNSATESLFMMLDQVVPTVEILSPAEKSTIYANYVNVEWTVNGEKQDTLNVQGLENGVNVIVRYYRDKAGNEASAKVSVIMKNAKDIEIHVEKPVTIVNADSVEKYYESNPPKKGDIYAVSVVNQKTGKEVETLVNGKKGDRDGSGDEPYPGMDGHLGPSLGIDLRLPQVSDVGGLATLDDLVGSDGMVALDGVDAAESKKVTVEEYVRDYCTDEFAKKRGKNDSKANLYDIDVDVNVWVFTTLGDFVDHYRFTQKMNEPDYVNEAAHATMNFEMKPDELGDLRTAEGRLLGTGAYLFKTEVKMKSKLRCTLPPVNDDQKPNSKKGSVISTSEELLKTFGYKRPKKSE